MPANALESAMDQLYAIEPAGFVALRKKLAAGLRADGDKDTAAVVAGLRKPTVAAAAINALARKNEPPAIPELSDLGARLRAAQSAMDAAALKELAKERSTLVDALLDRMGELTSTSREQAADTLVAGLADERAQAAVTSGHLVNPLSYSGFGEVEVSDAVAVPLRELQDARRQELARRDELKTGSKHPATTTRTTTTTTTKDSRTDAARTPATKAGPKPPSAQTEPSLRGPNLHEPDPPKPDLQKMIEAATAAEREALAAVEAARVALTAAKDHAATAIRARQLAEELRDHDGDA